MKGKEYAKRQREIITKVSTKKGNPTNATVNGHIQILDEEGKE